jgi:hypothetical protein
VNCSKVLNHSIEDSRTSQRVDSLTHRTQYSRRGIECRKSHEFSRSIYGIRQRALPDAVRQVEDYSGLFPSDVSQFCGPGNRPHLISSRLCDTRRSELIRSNVIVAAAITVLERSTPFFQAKCECHWSRRGLNRPSKGFPEKLPPRVSAIGYDRPHEATEFVPGASGNTHSEEPLCIRDNLAFA